jgi:hypothetical protein
MAVLKKGASFDHADEQAFCLGLGLDCISLALNLIDFMIISLKKCPCHMIVR